MDPQKNRESGAPGFLEGLQGEVAAENAPLLNFITQYAGWIAAAVLLILLVLGGMALWNWYHGSRQKEARAELARIEMQLTGAERNRALEALALTAPESVKLAIYLALAQSAQESGDLVLAGQAYAKAAELDGDGPIGMTAALGVAGNLLTQGDYGRALTLLREFEQKYPEAAQSAQFRLMTAEAATKAGDVKLARELYLKLAQEMPATEAAYFQTRADALAANATPAEGQSK